MRPSSSLVTVAVLSALFACSTSQESFQFCGNGRDLIHAMIKVCSRSLPDELAAPVERSTTRETTTTSTTTVSMEGIDEYLSRLDVLLELMYAASELTESDSRAGHLPLSSRRRRRRRSVALRRHRRDSMQRAKQVALKCCNSCSSADIETLCW